LVLRRAGLLAAAELAGGFGAAEASVGNLGAGIFLPHWEVSQRRRILPPGALRQHFLANRGDRRGYFRSHTDSERVGARGEATRWRGGVLGLVFAVWG
jgi:hypothetical protein